MVNVFFALWVGLTANTAVSFAQLTDQDTIATEAAKPFVVTVSSILLVLGIFLVSVSFDYFIYTLASAGFLLGALLSWTILTLAEPEHGYPSRNIVYFTTAVGVGILMAAAMMTCWNVGMAMFAGTAGYSFALYICSWRQDHILTNIYVLHLISAFVGFCAMASMVLFEYLTTVTSSSFLGAYCIIIAIDMLTHTGMVDGLRVMLDGNPNHHITYIVTAKTYAMLASVLVIWLIAMLWQIFHYRGKRFGVEIVPAEKNEK